MEKDSVRIIVLTRKKYNKYIRGVMHILPEQAQVIQRKKEEINRQIQEAMDNCFLTSVDSVFDVNSRLRNEFGIECASNQIDLIEAILDLDEKDVCETDARSGGKTFAAGIGLYLLCMDMKIKVGITAPTDGQANRIIHEFKTEVVPRSSRIRNSIDWKLTTNTRIVFTNGSVWESFSGNEVSNQEGRHYDILLMDESQDISDYAVSNILLPMIKSSKIHKVIKIGVPRSKNHFYRTAMSKEGIFLVHDWLHCPNLMNGGVFEFNGVKYPISVLDSMPYAKWQEYFPNNPELWREPPNSLSVEDFETQEEMKWLLDVNLFLNEKEQLLILGDFEFNHLETEDYYFGLDIAGGKDIKTGKKRDSTSLSIGRIKNGIKQKIDGYSWQGDAIDQMDEILTIIHPKIGKYKCKFGKADYGYNPMMVDALAKAGVNIESVQFGSRDQETLKNTKNILYESFKFELQGDRFKYPKKEFIDKHKVLKNHFSQWCVLEEKAGRSINSIIGAPSGFHDDACSSDVLLNSAMLTPSTKQQVMKKKEHTFPQLLQGISSITSIDKDIEQRNREVGGESGQGQKNSPFGKFIG